jgi:hypothetical protein
MGWLYFSEQVHAQILRTHSIEKIVIEMYSNALKYRMYGRYKLSTVSRITAIIFRIIRVTMNWFTILSQIVPLASTGLKR